MRWTLAASQLKCDSGDVSISVDLIGEQCLAWQYDRTMTFDVRTWWALLSAIAVLNVVVWLLTAKSLRRKKTGMPAHIYAARRLQLGLSAVYVLGCAYRSVLPVYDVPRLVMVDSWLSSVLVGRSVATIAELCFVAQLAVMLYELARSTGSTFAKRAALAAVPLIAVAETFSWYSVLTTANIGHVVEETIWGATATLLVISVITVRSRCMGALRYVLDACCAAGIGYVAYMFLVDVPMYWARWISDEAVGRSYLSIARGLSDAAARWTVSHRWEDWQHEVAWMSLYFSVAVWFSMSLIHAPLARPRTIIVQSKLSASINTAATSSK